MGNYFSKGSQTTYKTFNLKATYDQPDEAQKHTGTYCLTYMYFVLKQQSVLLAIEIKLTNLLASMFLFFFELAIVLQSPEAKNEVSFTFNWNGFKTFEMVVSTGGVMTICEPASHASHANFAFKSKHPFQIALINSY